MAALQRNRTVPSFGCAVVQSWHSRRRGFRALGFWGAGFRFEGFGFRLKGFLEV